MTFINILILHNSVIYHIQSRFFCDGHMATLRPYRQVRLYHYCTLLKIGAPKG
jgi:hypothetical protein